MISVQYDDRDAINTIRNLPQWWAQIVTAGHQATSCGLDELIAAAADAATALEVVPTAGRGESVQAFDVLQRTFASIHADLLDRPLDPRRRTVMTGLLASALLIVHDIGRVVHAATDTQTGTVASINRSAGGAPKTSVDHGEVDATGMAGDRQRSRQHHGRPWQAISLWSAEVIESLRSEGHPVRAGSAGENLTISGLDWAGVGPGMMLTIGQVTLECSMWAEPCRHIAHCFSDGRWSRIHHDHGPVSRLYASVRHGGVIRLGDRVVVEPR